MAKKALSENPLSAMQNALLQLAIPSKVAAAKSNPPVPGSAAAQKKPGLKSDVSWEDVMAETKKLAPDGRADLTGQVATSKVPPDGQKAIGVKPPPTPQTSKPEVVLDRVELDVAPDAKLVWDGTSQQSIRLLERDWWHGARTQISSNPEGSREVVIGFDFGTSSAKVVMGDLGLKKAHAVPFRKANGIDAYLLPARLYETNGTCSLHGGTRHFNDLKLALLADPENTSLQCRVVAYIALAIREARAWLFTEHAEDYIRTEIIWTLALGLPAEYANENDLTKVFARLGAAAWAMAEKELVSADACCKALADAAAGNTSKEIEVTVIPEIAAQIYGFVNSSQFDANARNFYLVADVGAGTVDTCLFRLVREQGQTTFEIYTAAVEPSGVMNLHRHRVEWWQRQLLAKDDVGAKLSKEFDSIKLGTEIQVAIPATYAGYLSGVGVQFAGNAVDPDQDFFRIPLVRQVQSRTLYRAFAEELLGPTEIENIPFFLCGGGARMEYYRNISDAIRRFEGVTWLSTTSQQLVMPKNLIAEGVGRSEFDRLSVAYGLSMLNLKSVRTAQQILKLPRKSSNEEWRDNFVDKDQC